MHENGGGLFAITTLTRETDYAIIRAVLGHGVLKRYGIVVAKGYGFAIALFCAMAGNGAEFFVSPAGSDDAAGSAVAPFATVQRAVDEARKAGGTNTVTFRSGVYRLAQTLTLDGRDSWLTLRAEKPGAAVISGGEPMKGWRRDGDRFWCVDVPGVKDGSWRFRMLLVNGAMAPRACFPGGTNRFENLGDWKLPLLPALAGHWERKPTFGELVTMPYKPEDLPDTLDFRSAEIRLYHMWAQSQSSVASNDLSRHVLYLSRPAAWPMGACGRRKYEVLNVREGLTEPGQWQLDHVNGILTYWPKNGEDMSKLKVEAPRLEILMMVKGTKKKPVSGLRIEGLVLENTTPPMRNAGFGGANMSAAVEMDCVTDVALERVEIRNTGGSGLVMRNAGRCRIDDCDIHDVGARGVGLYGSDSRIERSRVCRVGRMFHSSSIAGVGGERITVRGCEMFDGPYSGIIGSGNGMLFEGNTIHHVMRVLHDGAAIYGNMSRTVIRGNVAHDITPNGKGFGASAYYYDEGATDSVVERNVAMGVATPVHNHMTRNIQVRDNMFVSDGDMTISFARSVGCSFERNTCVAGGKLKVTWPDAIVSWTGNRTFHRRPDGERIEVDDGKPDFTPQKPQSPLRALRTDAPPMCDGEFAGGEWPGKWTAVNRDERRMLIGGPAAYVRAAWDATNLYVGVLMTNFRSARLTEGATWGVDDGVEVNVAGRRIRAYGNGTVDAAAVGKIAAHAGRKKGWKPWDGNKPLIYEFAVPFAALGVTPAKDVRMPFNVQVHCGEHNEDR